ncbi:MAG TPA: S9 family peptidase [Jiangellaceae bacterium]|nr:S9 family peptidase [Jiangellaceae bacterium]
MTVTAPYGTWKSPITAGLVAASEIHLGQVSLDEDDVYWVESRPAENGRNVLVRWRGGDMADVVPTTFDVRTRVHEYGGGAYAVRAGVVYFADFHDQRLYRLAEPGAPAPITPESDARLRFADAVVDTPRRRLICVREDHTAGGEAVNAIVSVDCAGDEAGGQVLESGRDFYSTPRLDPDGTRLVWLTWNHPNMPWDGTELWLGDVHADGSLVNHQLVAGGERESIGQPEWSPDGVLHFSSDRTGWWNLYRFQDGRTEALYQMDAEFCGPQWVFGQSFYAFVQPSLIACALVQDGMTRLAELDMQTHELREIDSPYNAIKVLRATQQNVTFIGETRTNFSEVVQWEVNSRLFTTLWRSSELAIDPGYISVAQPIEYPTENGLTAHAFFYAPKNRDFAAPPGERPPAVVMSHGGPTAAASVALCLPIQFWTSRGFAVLDVNYGGSTGYGRDYRERLNGQWGVVDVDDCVNGARFLVRQKLVDGDRMAITGGSAGGYTTLCALTFRDVFTAGASYYGVSDTEALAKETHKFESRYLDNLIGPYPERRELYVKRSPIHFADQISAPLILLQGLDDPVVPPNQSEAMFVAVRNKGLPTAYVTFEGEQHGFRKAENIKRALEAESYFYSRVFGLDVADEIEKITIENLD